MLYAFLRIPFLLTAVPLLHTLEDPYFSFVPNCSTLLPGTSHRSFRESYGVPGYYIAARYFDRCRSRGATRPYRRGRKDWAGDGTYRDDSSHGPEVLIDVPGLGDEATGGFDLYNTELWHGHRCSTLPCLVALMLLDLSAANNILQRLMVILNVPAHKHETVYQVTLLLLIRLCSESLGGTEDTG